MPHDQSVPSSFQIDAAVAVVKAWSERRVQPPPSLARPVFDYGVSLQVWRNIFGQRQPHERMEAGREFDEEKLPVHLQTLLASKNVGRGHVVGLPTEVSVKTQSGEVEYAVQEAWDSFAFHIVDSFLTLNAVPGHGALPSGDPLHFLPRPCTLFRLFDLLYSTNVLCTYRDGACRHPECLVERHLTRLPSTLTPHSPVLVFVLLRDLRILFEIDGEVEQRIGDSDGRRKQERVVTLASLAAHEHDATLIAEDEFFLTRDDWHALAVRARGSPLAPSWLHTVHRVGAGHMLELLLTHPAVAAAQAKLELSLQTARPLAFTRSLNGPTPEEALAQRNARAWTKAMEWFNYFFNTVARAHPEVVVRHSRFEPRARRGAHGLEQA